MHIQPYRNIWVFYRGLALGLALLLSLPTPDLWAAPSTKSIFSGKQASHEAVRQRNLRELDAKQGMVGKEKPSTDHSPSSTATLTPLSLASLQDLSALSIPPADGQILDVWQPTQSDSSLESRVSSPASRPTVILLQDLHTQTDAQLAEGRILEHLYKTYGVTHVASEGAWTPFALDLFQRFPRSREARQKLAQVFLDNGEMTGHEYQAVVKQLPLQMRGVETQSIYEENLAAFRSIIDRQPPAVAVLERIGRALEDLQARLVHPPLNELVELEHRFQHSELTLMEYVEQVLQRAGRADINVDAEAIAPNVVRFARLTAVERELPSKLVIQQEQQAFLRAMSVAAQPSGDASLQSELGQVTLQFQAGQTSTVHTLEQCVQLGARAGVGLPDYPALAAFVEYLRLSRTMQMHALYPELEQLSFSVGEALAQDVDERQWWQWRRGQRLLTDAVHVRLTRAQLNIYRLERPSLERLVAFCVQHGQSPEVDVEAVTAIQPLIEQFYTLAEARDRALVENTLSWVQGDTPRSQRAGARSNAKDSVLLRAERPQGAESRSRASGVEKADAVLLVAGGFHTEGMTALLRERGFPYLVITPTASGEVDEALYHRLIRGETHSLEELAASAKAASASDAILAADSVMTKTDGPKIATVGAQGSERLSAGESDKSSDSSVSTEEGDASSFSKRWVPMFIVLFAIGIILGVSLHELMQHAQHVDAEILDQTLQLVKNLPSDMFLSEAPRYKEVIAGFQDLAAMDHTNQAGVTLTTAAEQTAATLQPPDMLTQGDSAAAAQLQAVLDQATSGTAVSVLTDATGVEMTQAVDQHMVAIDLGQTAMSQNIGDISQVDGGAMPLAHRAEASLMASTAAAAALPAIDRLIALPADRTTSSRVTTLTRQAFVGDEVASRCAAIRDLGGTEDAEAILPLVWALRDEETSVRREAIEALGKLIFALHPMPRGLGLVMLQTVSTLASPEATNARRVLHAMTPAALHALLARLDLRIPGEVVEMVVDETRGVEFLSDYSVNPALGRSLDVMMAIKNTEQLESDRQAIINLRSHDPFARYLRGADRRVFHRRGGFVLATSLSKDNVKDSFWSLQASQPSLSVAFSGDKQRMLIGGGDSVRLYDRRTQQVREYAYPEYPWLRSVHTVAFSDDEKRIRICSSGFDMGVEIDIDTRQVTWDWSLWDDGGLARSPLGHFLTRSPEKAAAWRQQGRSVLLVDDPSKSIWAGRGIPTRQRLILNDIQPLDDGRYFLGSVFQKGLGIVIDRATGHAYAALPGLRSPHAFLQDPNGALMVVESGAGVIRFMDDQLRPTRQILMEGMPGVVRDARIGEWLQYAHHLEGSLYVAVDMHRSTIWLFDMEKRTRRGIRVPPELGWAVQNLVVLPEEWKDHSWMSWLPVGQTLVEHVPGVARDQQTVIPSHFLQSSDLVVIFTGGQGRRLGSDERTPKAVREVANKPMILWLVDAAEQAETPVIVLVGYGAQAVKSVLGDRRNVCVVDVPPVPGPVDALAYLARLLEGYHGHVIVAPVDAPATSPELLRGLRKRSGVALTLVTAVVDDAGEYGRVVRNRSGKLECVVNPGKLAAIRRRGEVITLSDGTTYTADQIQAIREMHHMRFRFQADAVLPLLRDPERFWDPVVEKTTVGALLNTIIRMGLPVETVPEAVPGELLGVNTQEQLDRMDNYLRQRLVSAPKGAETGVVDLGQQDVMPPVMMGVVAEVANRFGEFADRRQANTEEQIAKEFVGQHRQEGVVQSVVDAAKLRPEPEREAILRAWLELAWEAACRQFANLKDNPQRRRALLTALVKYLLILAVAVGAGMEAHDALTASAMVLPGARLLKSGDGLETSTDTLQQQVERLVQRAAEAIVGGRPEEALGLLTEVQGIAGSPEITAETVQMPALEQIVHHYLQAWVFFEDGHYGASSTILSGLSSSMARDHQLKSSVDRLLGVVHGRQLSLATDAGTLVQDVIERVTKVDSVPDAWNGRTIKTILRDVREQWAMLLSRLAKVPEGGRRLAIVDTARQCLDDLPELHRRRALMILSKLTKVALGVLVVAVLAHAAGDAHFAMTVPAVVRWGVLPGERVWSEGKPQERNISYTVYRDELSIGHALAGQIIRGLQRAEKLMKEDSNYYYRVGIPAGSTSRSTIEALKQLLPAGNPLWQRLYVVAVEDNMHPMEARNVDRADSGSAFREISEAFEGRVGEDRMMVPEVGRVQEQVGQLEAVGGVDLMIVGMAVLDRAADASRRVAFPLTDLEVMMSPGGIVACVAMGEKEAELVARFAAAGRDREVRARLPIGFLWDSEMARQVIVYLDEAAAAHVSSGVSNQPAASQGIAGATSDQGSIMLSGGSLVSQLNGRRLVWQDGTARSEAVALSVDSGRLTWGGDEQSLYLTVTLPIGERDADVVWEAVRDLEGRVVAVVDDRGRAVAHGVCDFTPHADRLEVRVRLTVAADVVRGSGELLAGRLRVGPRPEDLQRIKNDVRRIDKGGQAEPVQAWARRTLGCVAELLDPEYEGVVSVLDVDVNESVDALVKALRQWQQEAGSRRTDLESLAGRLEREYRRYQEHLIRDQESGRRLVPSNLRRILCAAALAAEYRGTLPAHVDPWGLALAGTRAAHQPVMADPRLLEVFQPFRERFSIGGSTAQEEELKLAGRVMQRYLGQTGSFQAASLRWQAMCDWAWELLWVDRHNPDLSVSAEDKQLAQGFLHWMRAMGQREGVFLVERNDGRLEITEQDPLAHNEEYKAFTTPLTRIDFEEGQGTGVEVAPGLHNQMRLESGYPNGVLGVQLVVECQPSGRIMVTVRGHRVNNEGLQQLGISGANRDGDYPVLRADEEYRNEYGGILFGKLQGILRNLVLRGDPDGHDLVDILHAIVPDPDLADLDRRGIHVDDVPGGVSWMVNGPEVQQVLLLDLKTVQRSLRDEPGRWVRPDLMRKALGLRPGGEKKPFGDVDSDQVVGVVRVMNGEIQIWTEQTPGVTREALAIMADEEAALVEFREAVDRFLDLINLGVVHTNWVTMPFVSLMDLERYQKEKQQPPFSEIAKRIVRELPETDSMGVMTLWLLSCDIKPHRAHAAFQLMELRRALTDPELMVRLGEAWEVKGSPRTRAASKVAELAPPEFVEWVVKESGMQLSDSQRLELQAQAGRLTQQLSPSTVSASAPTVSEAGIVAVAAPEAARWRSEEALPLIKQPPAINTKAPLGKDIKRLVGPLLADPLATGYRSWGVLSRSVHGYRQMANRVFAVAPQTDDPNVMATWLVASGIASRGAALEVASHLVHIRQLIERKHGPFKLARSNEFSLSRPVLPGMERLRYGRTDLLLDALIMGQNKVLADRAAAAKARWLQDVSVPGVIEEVNVLCSAFVRYGVMLEFARVNLAAPDVRVPMDPRTGTMGRQAAEQAVFLCGEFGAHVSPQQAVMLDAFKIAYGEGVYGSYDHGGCVGLLLLLTDGERLPEGQVGEQPQGWSDGKFAAARCLKALEDTLWDRQHMQRLPEVVLGVQQYLQEHADGLQQRLENRLHQLEPLPDVSQGDTFTRDVAAAKRQILEKEHQVAAQTIVAAVREPWQANWLKWFGITILPIPVISSADRQKITALSKKSLGLGHADELELYTAVAQAFGVTQGIGLDIAFGANLQPAEAFLKSGMSKVKLLDHETYQQRHEFPEGMDGLLGDATQIPLPSGGFSVVVCNASLYFVVINKVKEVGVYREESIRSVVNKVCAEGLRVLAPGGWMFVRTTQAGWQKGFIEGRVVEDALRGMGCQVEVFTARYTKREVVEYLSQNLIQLLAQEEILRRIFGLQAGEQVAEDAEVEIPVFIAARKPHPSATKGGAAFGSSLAPGASGFGTAIPLWAGAEDAGGIVEVPKDILVGVEDLGGDGVPGELDVGHGGTFIPAWAGGNPSERAGLPLREQDEGGDGAALAGHLQQGQTTFVWADAALESATFRAYRATLEGNGARIVPLLQADIDELVRQGNVIFVGELKDFGSLLGEKGFQDLVVDAARLARWRLRGDFVIGTNADFSAEKLKQYMQAFRSA